VTGFFVDTLGSNSIQVFREFFLYFTFEEEEEK
jgi:hypothetical protein